MKSKPSILSDLPAPHNLSKRGEEEELANWGIEPATYTQSSSSQETSFSHYFDNPESIVSSPSCSLTSPATSNIPDSFRRGHRSTKSQTSMQPLLLAKEHGFSREVQRNRLQAMIHQSLRPRLETMENVKFLERFRYIQVSCALLDKSPYPLSTKVKLSSDLQHSTMRHSKPGPKTDKQYWTRGSGSMVVMLVMIDFLAKRALFHAVTCTLSRLVINFGRLLYLFAYSRRTKLRHLRTNAVANVKRFIEYSQEFDAVLAHSMSIIKQTEVNGDPNMLIAGRQLRSSASAALYLCTSDILEASQGLLPFCNQYDLDKYLEMYEIDMSVIDQFGWERVKVGDGSGAYDDKYTGFVKATINVPRAEFAEPIGTHASIPKLKFDRFKLHFLRRLFICCLISIPSSGDCTIQEITAWSMVDSKLHGCWSLLKQLKSTLLPKQTFDVFDVSDEQALSGISSVDVWQYHMRSLNSISYSLRRMERQMEILRDSSIQLANDVINQNEADGASLPTVEYEFEHNFNLIGNDLKAAMSLWEKSKNDVESIFVAHRKTRRSTIASPLPQFSPLPFYEDMSSPSRLSFCDQQSSPTSEMEHPSQLSRVNPSIPFLLSPQSPNKRFSFTGHHRRHSSELTTLSGATVTDGGQANPGRFKVQNRTQDRYRQQSQH